MDEFKRLFKRKPAGSLTGKQLNVADVVVKVDKVLGEGGFATIYRCTDVETGSVYALKHFLLTGYPEAVRDVETEVGVMERLAGCPYVVTMHEAALNGPRAAPTSAVLLLDYCPDTLVNFLQQRGFRLEEPTILQVFLPIACAVHAMHSLQPPLAHRDLKAENVLLGPSGRWVLCDFGSASTRHGVLESAHDIALEEEVVRRYTTPAYRAPELYDLYAREFVGPPVDIWALGVLLYLLCYGRLPFEGEAKLQVLNGRYSLPEGRHPALRALIKDMLTVSPRQRPTIAEVLGRLADFTPQDLWESVTGLAHHQPPAAAQAAAAGPAGGLPAATNGSSAATSTPAPPAAQHARAPSQGWADFASDGSPVAATASSSAAGAAATSTSMVQRRSGSGGGSGSGSGSWATFSPKASSGATTAAAAAPAVPAVSAGSFWSSFGDEVPLAAAAEEVQVQGGQVQGELSGEAGSGNKRLPLPQQQQQPLSAAPAPVAAASSSQQRSPPTAASTPPRGLVAAAGADTDAEETSPLSAGLARLSQGTVNKPPAGREAGSPPVCSPQDTAATSARRPSAGSAPAPAAPPAASAAAAASSAAAADVVALAGEVEELRQHCQVLEQLLEVRNEEIRRLQKLTAQQAGEIERLRRQQQQHARGSGSSASAAAAAASVAATPLPAAPASSARTSASASAATPASSRLGQDVRVQVPGDGEGGGQTPSGESWVSFNAASSREQDAPTPTLLAPDSSSGFRGSGGSQVGAVRGAGAGINAGGAADGRQAQAQARPAPAPAATPAASSSSATGLEAALRAKLNLGRQGSGGLASSDLGPAATAAAATPALDARQRQQQQQGPMRAPDTRNSAAAAAALTGGGSGSGHQHSLRSFPVQLTPSNSSSTTATGPLDTGAAATAASWAGGPAKPSPVRTASAGLHLAVSASASGSMSPMHSGSPMHSRTGSRPGSGLGGGTSLAAMAAAGGSSGTTSLAGGRARSPAKHRRNVTAPDGGFFDDLNPLH